jgi:predicted transcriptional regulator
MKYFVSFSKSELDALRLLDSFDNPSELSKVLRVSESQAYRIIKSLKVKGAVVNNSLADVPYLKKLVLLMQKYENLVGLFRDSNLAVLLHFLSERTVKEVADLTGCNAQTIYKAIQKARLIGLILKIKNKFVINGSNWPQGKEFFEELLRQEMSFDKRVPKDAIIFYKSEKEIVFSTKNTVDAARTAFSAFENFGIKLFTVTNYCYLPKRKLSAQEVFDHALMVTKKDMDYRSLTYLAIFLLKNRVTSRDDVIKKIYQVFGGAPVYGFPSRRDLQEKADLYDVSLP